MIRRDVLVQSGVMSVEMESDTLFIVGQYRGLRTGALYVSDGTKQEIKPDWGMDRYYQGEEDMIKLPLRRWLPLLKRMQSEASSHVPGSSSY